jgi:hypothetical protein
MAETVIVSDDDSGNAEVQAAELSSVAAAGSAAGVAAVNAQTAEEAAAVAESAAVGTAEAAQVAVTAAAQAEDAASIARDAQYATADQAERMLGMQEQIMTALQAIAEKPAPEPTKQKSAPRDSAPKKPEHFLRRKVGGSR